MGSYPGAGLVVAGLVGWAGCVLLTLYFLAEPWFGFAGCELIPGRSLYGEPSRTWVPPGLTCSYGRYEMPGTLASGDTYVVSPSPLRLVVVGLALSGLPVCLRLHRLLRRAVPASSRS